MPLLAGPAWLLANAGRGTVTAAKAVFTSARTVVGVLRTFNRTASGHRNCIPVSGTRLLDSKPVAATARPGNDVDDAPQELPVDETEAFQEHGLIATEPRDDASYPTLPDSKVCAPKPLPRSTIPCCCDVAVQERVSCIHSSSLPRECVTQCKCRCVLQRDCIQTLCAGRSGSFH